MTTSDMIDRPERVTKRASLTERRAAHAAKMARKAQRRERFHAQAPKHGGYNGRGTDASARPDWRKSIWPKGKVAKTGRMG